MPTEDASSSVMLRRRDKRRHVSSDSAEMRDPLHLLSLAARLDEVASIHHGTSLLTVPFEAVRLYNQDDFQAALAYLKTTASPEFNKIKPRTRSRSPLGWLLVFIYDLFSNSQKPPYANVAITPIILAGVIRAQYSRERELEESKTTARKTDKKECMPSSSELLLQCVAMRRLGVKRLAWRKKKRIIQMIAFITFINLTIYSCYMHTMGTLSGMMVELGYVGSFDTSGTGDTTILAGIIPKMGGSPLHPCAGMSITYADYLDAESKMGEFIQDDAEDPNDRTAVQMMRWRSIIPFINFSRATKIASGNQDKSATRGDSEGINLASYGYEKACLAAETDVWTNFRDYALSSNQGVRICSSAGCGNYYQYYIRRLLADVAGRMEDFKHRHAPYVLQTIARENTQELFVPPMDLTSTHSENIDECEVVNENINFLGNSTVNHLIARVLEKKLLQSNNTGGEIRAILDAGCGIGGLLYSLAHSLRLVYDNMPETCWEKNQSPSQQFLYEGISISGAEIQHARGLAGDHGINPMKYRFTQMSFDDPAFRQASYSAAIAVESLSFSQEIAFSLSRLADALLSGGIMIIVDDTVNANLSCDADKERQRLLLDSYTLSSGRSTLVTQSQWLNLLDQCGFEVDEVVDLGLHFDLPLLVDTRTKLPAKIVNWFGRQYWQSNYLLRLLKVWERLMTRSVVHFYQSVFSGDGEDVSFIYSEMLDRAIYGVASMRVAQMLQGYVHRTRALSLRKEAHEQGFLTYNMYICTKR